MRARGGLLVGLALLAAAGAYADLAIPPVARVTDLTATLSADQQTGLSAKLAALEREKGSQVAVLIVPTTQPETIEEYGIRVASAWKLGRKGVDDGAILLVAKDDHRVRIEVGYGLEGAIPDAIAKRVIDEIIVPKFRDGDFAGGVDAGTDALVKTIQGEPLPAAPPRPKSTAAPQDRFGGAFFVFIVALFVGRILKRLLGTGIAAGAVGVGTGVVVGLITASLVIGALAGFAALVAALLVFASAGGGMGGMGGLGYGGFGGGSGGGGFSGGGGGFGGGGASGNW